jgi:hypothetical protein
LAGATAPTYTANNFMRGNFAAVTVGEYLIQEPGIIEQVSFDWSTDYNWHTSVYSTEEETTEKKTEIPEVPTVLDVSITFTPIHTITPQFGNKFIGRKNRLYKPEVELDEVVVTAIKEDEQV